MLAHVFALLDCTFLRERESFWLLYPLWHLQMFIELNQISAIFISFCAEGAN